MEGLIFGMILLAFGLLIWAAIGHAIWMICGKIVVSLLGTSCQRCGRKSLLDRECPYCASRPADPVTALPSVNDDLSAAKRLLQYSRFQQWLSEEQHDSLASLLQRLSLRVGGDPAAARALASNNPAEPESRASAQAPLMAS